ncbi:MAG: hypothetical protein GXP63_02860 [DPANN group archaeon]|nr:hypothetical protein [DPANN group archaeon]
MSANTGLFSKKAPAAQQPPRPSKPGLFSSKKTASSVDPVKLSNDLASLSSRIRIIEERYDNLRRKTQVTDQNMLMNHRKALNETKILHDNVTEIKREIMEIKDKIRMIIKDLNDSARKEDILVLQKYINLWEPVNFVTRNEVKTLIHEELESLGQEEDS